MRTYPVRSICSVLGDTAVNAEKSGPQVSYRLLGNVVCRIEDTDLARSTKESEDKVLADLRWLGIDWDEGVHGCQHCKPTGAPPGNLYQA